MLSKININHPLTINCNGCTKTYPAKITNISSKVEYTPPVIFSEKTRDKLLYKVKASFLSTTDAMNFHPGQPVDVYLTTK